MAHPSVDLMGAIYADVPAVLLPKDGGGTARFDDTSDADAVASDIANGKTAYVNGVKLTGTSSGGGTSNIVQGSFTTGATRNTTGTVTLGYTGNGYPIAFLVFVHGGAYNNTSSGDADWYNSVHRYDVGWVGMVKSQVPTTPTYTTSGGANQGTIALIYKNSTSTATSYTRTSAMNANTFTSASGNPTNSTKCIVFKGNKNTLAYFVGNSASNSIGLAPSTTYDYIVIYSA